MIEYAIKICDSVLDSGLDITDEFDMPHPKPLKESVRLTLNQ